MAEKKEKETQVETGSVDQLLGMLESTEEKSALQEFFSRLGKEHEVFRVTGALIDSYIAEIDKVLSAQVDEILHNEEFQSLESHQSILHRVNVNFALYGHRLPNKLRDTPC